jgi:fumarylacetoacetase
MALDETHDAARRSWVETANAQDCDFPIQNLPLGVFRHGAGPARVGIAIGDRALDVGAAAAVLGLTGEALAAARACEGQTLDALAALGRAPRRALRLALSRAFAAGLPGWEARRRALDPLLRPVADCELLVPFAIGDYTDFYASLFHAENVGRLFRPDNPLLPNYKWVPIGYHGRASSVIASGTPFVRPSGQIKAQDAASPVFGPSARLDYEVELGLFVGPGNALGAPIPVARALEHVFGAVLLIDWSARDIQAWEYQPLGPFLAKSFATTISPWVVTLEALEPFRAPPYARAEGDPAPLPYLLDAADQRDGALAIELDMHLRSARMRAAAAQPLRLSRGNTQDLYWTPAQLLAHHSSNGCNLRTGDLLGTGTISGAAPDSLGSLIELTRGGKQPVALPGGETRSFLADGDELILRGRCTRAGRAAIGLGEARATVLPASDWWHRAGAARPRDDGGA